jgi:hypothetical protein
LPKGDKFPKNLDEKVNMVSTFYVDSKKKVQAKMLKMILFSITYGTTDINLGEIEIDLSKYYGKRK